MNNINVEALLSTLAPMNFTAQSGVQKPTGSADGLFLNLLQSFAESLGGEAQAETAQSGASPGDWLAALFGLLTPAGAPNNLLPTPDSPGEASDGTDEPVSLTDMMAAIQALAAGNTPGALTAEQMMQALAQSAETAQPATDGDTPEKTLDVMAEELGLAQNPAILAALTRLQQNASPGQPEAKTADAAATGSTQPAINTAAENLSPAVTLPQPADTPAAKQHPAQSLPSGITPAENEPIATDTPAAHTAPAAKPVAAKPTADPAVAFAKTLDAAQGKQTSAAPPASSAAPPAPSSPAPNTVPAPDTTARTEPASGEKTITLPTDVPTVTAPQSSAAPPVSAPAAADAPTAPTLPNIPALHQLVDTISVLKQNGQTAVRLHLHPESLGQVLVQMHVHNGDVTVQLLTETGKAQALIQNHLPELKAAFSAQGVSTGALSVSVGSDASAFAAPQRQNFQWQNSGNRTAPTATDDLPDVSPATRVPTNRYTSGRIDYHV